MKLKNITKEVFELEKSLKNKPFMTDKEAIISDLSKLLTQAVMKRCEGKIGIAFSGGLDSVLLAFIVHKSGQPFTLFNVGVRKAQDLDWASRIAKHYGWRMKQKVVTVEHAEPIIKKAVSIIPDPSVVKTGIAAAEMLVLQMAKDAQVDCLLGGLGAEEIFAGYGRHMKAFEDGTVHEECWDGLKKLHKNDLERDFAVVNHFKVNLQCPFLDKELVEFAMLIDPKLKIDAEHKKLILIETAIAMGLEKEFAFRPKKAMQYGSGFHQAIEKLSKKNGYKYKQEYLDSLR